MSSIVLTNLTKRFDGVTAVDDVNLEIRAGELLVLVGPSGCGKTTLLRLIAGLEQPDRGTIQIGERTVDQLPPRDRHVAMVFQKHALYPHLSIYENLAFGLRMRRLPKTVIQQRVRDAAETLEIDRLLNRKPSQLSGGQQQRVALGRAMVQEPQAFLLDEPLSSLDAALRGAMRTELVRLQKRLRVTMIHVTHEQQEAMQMGHRIAVIHEGRIQQVGSPQEIYRAPANRFVAGLIGDPPMNFLEGTFVIEGDQACVRCADFPIYLPPEFARRCRQRANQPISLGIRPEDILAADQIAQAECPALLQAEIVTVQGWGRDTVLGLQAGSCELAARTDSRTDFRVGQQIQIALDTSRCHLF